MRSWTDLVDAEWLGVCIRGVGTVHLQCNRMELKIVVLRYKS